MVDISKCSGDGCAIRKTCYRYTIQSNASLQSWIDPSECLAHNNALFYAWPVYEASPWKTVDLNDKKQ